MFYESKIFYFVYFYILLLLVAFFIFYIAFQISKSRRINNILKGLSDNTETFTPQEFFELRNTKRFDGKTYISTAYAFTGVYIIFNEDKDLYYVGQGKNVLNRVNSHFTGSGNGDVYADYKYGDSFQIKMVSLTTSGYHNLDELERKMIKFYDAHGKGYNKNRGNRTYRY